MTRDELITLQSLPLEVKIQKSLNRIIEFVDMYGIEGVYTSFSGGKDSVVLLHLIRSIYPNVEAVFSNTGLEFPEIVSFVKTFENMTIVHPDRNFKEILKTEGYPVVSKINSRKIRFLQNPTPNNFFTRRMYLEGIKKDGTPCKKASSLPKKWHKLKDAPFKVSEKCCKYMKKDPLINFSKTNNKYPFIGTMAHESELRRKNYLKTGCNIYEGNIQSMPLGFWTEQDILEYIVTNNLEICSVYGEIKKDCDNNYILTGEQRTGCIFCMYGIHLHKQPNKFQRMKNSHPKLYNYCIKPMDEGGLGIGKVLDYINVPYK